MTLYWVETPKEVYDGDVGAAAIVHDCSFVCDRHAHLESKDASLTAVDPQYQWETCAHCAAEQKGDTRVEA